MLSRSRSSSPSSDTPASVHSSPASSDFVSTDHAASWRVDATNGVFKQDTIHLYGSRNNLQARKYDDEQDGGIFSEFIQEDAFDPAPLASPLRSSTITPAAVQSFAYPSYQHHPQATSYPTPFPVLQQTINPREAQQLQQSSASAFQTQESKGRPSPAKPSINKSQPQATSQSLQFSSLSVPSTLIFPHKSACSNLPIIVSNVPAKGAKSRVETQIKVDLHLAIPDIQEAFAAASTATNFHRVGTYKWLRLNKASVTKRRPKKDAKQVVESLPEDTLYLSTEVLCATPPHIRVFACTNCLQREAKRVERKKASRIRPARSDSEDDETTIPPVVARVQKTEDDYSFSSKDEGSKIVLFNCPELVDFSKGSASLPVRVTCYCRHHREKTGFRIIFTLRDCEGRIVGRGATPPIMITDDHKSTQKQLLAQEEDDDNVFAAEESQPKRKRKTAGRRDSDEHDGDIYMDQSHSLGELDFEEENSEDASRTKRRARRDGGSSGSRPSTSMGTRKSLKKPAAISARSSRRSTPSRRGSPSSSILPPSSTAVSTINPSPASAYLTPASSYPSPESTSGLYSPEQHSKFNFNVMAAASSLNPGILFQTENAQSPTNNEIDLSLSDSVSIGNPQIGSDDQLLQRTTYQNLSAALVSSAPSPLNPYGLDGSSYATLTRNDSLFASTDANQEASIAAAAAALAAPATLAPLSGSQQTNVGPPLPVIHRLIPCSGPMHGGIEVTILGANFMPQHECVFGDVVATSTQLWSDNTLVCILPPSPCPGPVVVSFKGVPIVPGIGMGVMDGMMGLGGMGSNNGLQLFTYLDNTDRALMELALQVVGLQMTGRIEDAKNVAMRIVGSNSSDMSGGTSTTAAGNGQTMTTASSQPSGSDTVFDPRQLLALGGRSRDFQSVIIEFLSLMKVELGEQDGINPSSRPSIEEAISHTNPSGQTLLHLSTILGFHKLVSALINYGIDVDVRDRNGYTALHFAAVCGRLACARLLVEGGADVEIVEGKGKTAMQLAKERDQADVECLLDEAEKASRHAEHRDEEWWDDVDGDADASASAVSEDEGDEESAIDDDTPLSLGTGEQESTIAAESPLPSLTPPSPRMPRSAMASRPGSRAISRKTSRVAFMDTPVQQEEPDHVPHPDLYSSNEEDNGLVHHPRRRIQRRSEDVTVADASLKDAVPVRPGKAASIVDASSAWITRTLAHLQPSQAMVPAQWNLPGFYIPEIPAFQVLPTWTNALPWQGGEKQLQPQNKDGSEKNDGSWIPWYGSAAGNWWSEKQNSLNAPPQQPHVLQRTPSGSVPMYTPTEDEVAAQVPSYTAPPFEGDPSEVSGASGSGASNVAIRAKLARKLGYEPPNVTDRDVHAYTYHSRKMRRLKQDRMLLLFWLPILLIVLAWGLYESVPVAITAFSKTARGFISLRNPVNV
ncbi:SPT3 Dosage dependent suppressor of Ty-induced promoter mutations-like protein [Tulasnella sp. 418]|nr:SPT3 Dosage dependent suppressor of Ty-induced promoter mutations-like protein [Tulasnella sp. 418]